MNIVYITARAVKRFQRLLVFLYGDNQPNNFSLIRAPIDRVNVTGCLLCRPAWRSDPSATAVRINLARRADRRGGASARAAAAELVDRSIPHRSIPRRVVSAAHIMASSSSLAASKSSARVALARGSKTRSGARRPARVAVAAAASASSAQNVTPSNSSSKPVAIITGASSGLGLYTTKALIEKGYFVVMAVRNPEKAVAKANELGFDKKSYAVMYCELGELQSVRDFASAFRRSKYVNDFQALVCNAALYLPNATVPSYTKDGFEECVGVNHLAHHLLCLLLLDDLAKAPDANMKRCIIVGSVTGNTNTLAGQVPPRAGLGDMSGLKNGFKNSDRNQGALIDGSRFIGAKAYKDSKLCNMLDVKVFAERYGESTGIKFSTMYPGCIAESNLFRNHTPFFRWLFPIIQKNVTKGYVSEEEAGQRLASIVYDPRYTEQGAYWAWKGGGDQLWDNFNNNNDKTRTIAFNNKPSREGRDMEKANAMFDISTELVGYKPNVMDGVSKSFDRLVAGVAEKIAK